MPYRMTRQNKRILLRLRGGDRGTLLKVKLKKKSNQQTAQSVKKR